MDKEHQEKQKKKRNQGNQMKKEGKKKAQDGARTGTIQHHPVSDHQGTSIHYSDLSDRLVPDQTRLHNVPPKKSLSPSFIASHLEGTLHQSEQLHTVQHHPTSQTSVVASKAGGHDIWTQMLTAQAGQSSRPLNTDQGGLLRQQLLQGIRADPPRSSPSQYRPGIDLPQSSPLYRSPPPNRTVHNIPGSSPVRASLSETDRTSPYHVSTIRKTPSPAPRRSSPQPHYRRVSPTQTERTQLSLEEAVKLMQGHPTYNVPAHILAQLSSQQPVRQEQDNVPAHILAQLSSQQPVRQEADNLSAHILAQLSSQQPIRQEAEDSPKAKELAAHKTEKSSKQFISTMLANQAKSRQTPGMVSSMAVESRQHPGMISSMVAESRQPPGLVLSMDNSTGNMMPGLDLTATSIPAGMMLSQGLTVDTDHGMPSSQFVRVSPVRLPRQISPSAALPRQTSPSGGIQRQVSPSGVIHNPATGGIVQRQVSPSGVRQVTSIGPTGLVTQTAGLLQPQLTTASSVATSRIPSPKPQHRHKEFAQKAMTNINTSKGPVRQPVLELVKIPISKSVDGKLQTFSASHMANQMTSVTSHVNQLPFSQPPQSFGVTMTTDISKPSQGMVNPFTFPSKPLTVITQPKNQPRYEVISPEQKKKLTDVEMPQKRKLSDIEMPHLDPVPSLKKEPSPVKIEMVKMKSPFNMRMQNLANLPTNSMYRATYRAHSLAVHRAKAGLITSTAKTLDLLRQNLQKFINKEIDSIVKQYLDTFFKPGIENIKTNNGDNSVTDEHVQAVCRQILEEAKKMYTTEQRSATPVRDENTPLPFSRKRNASDTDSDKSGPNFTRKKKGRPPIYSSGRSTPSKPAKANEPVKREGPKWDSNRLIASTQYIMGARANKALGLGATRGRIYIKHPDVFKYCGDQDDKQWLYENHKMPATGGKAYMMLLEDVKDLAEDDEYRNNANVMMDEIVGFCIPDWMTEKVKVQMEGLRTDKVKQRSRSATPNNGQPSSHLDGNDVYKQLPFSAFTTTKDSLEKDLQTSPSADTEMEFLTGGGNQNNLSPFNLTGGFEEGVSPSASDLDNLDEDTPISAPFGQLR